MYSSSPPSQQRQRRRTQRAGADTIPSANVLQSLLCGGASNSLTKNAISSFEQPRTEVREQQLLVPKAPEKKEERIIGECYLSDGEKKLWSGKWWRKACVMTGCTTRALDHPEHGTKCSKHSTAKPFACPFEGCDYRCATSGTLKTHERTHTGEKPFACTFEGCGYRCSQSTHLNIHKRTHTGEKPFACTFEGCGYRCNTSCTLKNHKRTHTGEKPFACSFGGCDYRCAQSGDIKTHERTHTGEKPFVCTFEGCDYRCNTSGALKIHERTHTGEKPYVCTFEGCSYRCSQSGHFESHKRTHTGEKPFACTFEGCDYRGAQLESLKIHERTHTGEKPYACTFEGCDYRSTTSGTLKIHKRTHTGEKPYVCTFEGCNERFAQLANRKSHHERNHTKAGQARRKKQEQRVCRALVKAGYIECTQLGDAAPPPRHFIREKHIDFRCVGDMDGRCAYIDFVVNPGEGLPLVFLEVDEGQHRYGYGEAGCDMRRMAKVMETLTLSGFNSGILWLRYNPDGFQVNGVTQDGRSLPEYTKASREAWLTHRLQTIAPLSTTSLAIEYAYYDVDTTESTTKPRVVYSDAGYHPQYAACASIAPGCCIFFED